MSPPLPSFPTDNLYKFIALAGLSLCFFCFFAALLAERDVALRLAEEEGIIRVAELEKQRFDNAQISVDTMEPRNAFIAQRILRHLGNVEKARQSHERLKELVQQRIAQRLFTTGGFVVGLIAAWVGFSLWYFRLQRYQDARAKKDAEAV